MNVKPQNAQLNKVVNVKKQKKNAILNPQRNVIADLLGDYSLLIFDRKGHNQTKLGSTRLCTVKSINGQHLVVKGSTMFITKHQGRSPCS